MKCINHLDLDAVGVCSKCGRGLCPECKHEVGGKMLCQVCADVYSQVHPDGITAPSGENKATQASASAFTTEFGGFWRRLGAYLIDGIILSIIGLPIRLLAPHTYFYGVSALISLIYLVGFWSWKSQTPGKMAMGLKIIAADGSRMGLGRAILRYLGYFVSAIILGLGFIMIAFDSHKQGLHDKIAGTYVIRK